MNYTSVLCDILSDNLIWIQFIWWGLHQDSIQNVSSITNEVRWKNTLGYTLIKQAQYQKHHARFDSFGK